MICSGDGNGDSGSNGGEIVTAVVESGEINTGLIPLFPVDDITVPGLFPSPSPSRLLALWSIIDRFLLRVFFGLSCIRF